VSLAALRRRFFGDALNGALTLLLIAAAILWLPPLFRWAVLNARFAPDVAAC